MMSVKHSLILVTVALLAFAGGVLARGLFPMNLASAGGTVFISDSPPIDREALEAVNEQTDRIRTEVLGERRGSFYELKVYPASSGMGVLLVCAGSTPSVSDAERSRIFERLSEVLHEHWARHPDPSP